MNMRHLQRLLMVKAEMIQFARVNQKRVYEATIVTVHPQSTALGESRMIKDRC